MISSDWATYESHARTSGKVIFDKADPSLFFNVFIIYLLQLTIEYSSVQTRNPGLHVPGSPGAGFQQL